MAKRTMPRQRPGLSESSVGTPPEFILAACRKLGIQDTCFVFDLAADEHNTKCGNFYDESDNALAEGVSWVFNGICWLNPPYDRISLWVAKACVESANGAQIAILIPASIGARWWINHVVGKCQIIPLDGRIVFVGKNKKGLTITDPYPKDCALLVYGPDVEIGYAPAWKWMDELTEEEREMAKKRIGKTTKKPKGGSKKKTVKADKKAKGTRAAASVTDISTRKKRGGGKNAEATPAMETGWRVTTFTQNGSTSQGIPALTEFNPGKIELPSPEDSVKLLMELATLNDQALKANSRYEELKGFTKDAKEKYDDLMKRVGQRLRNRTHASDLPLFANVEKREQDQAAMEAGPTAIPASEPEPVSETPPAAASEPSSDDLTAGAEIPPPAPPAVPGLADEEIPF